MIPAKHTPSGKHEDHIPHVPYRGLIRVDEDTSLGGSYSFALMEVEALVTYHRVPVVEVGGIRCLDLNLPVVATWVAGDGTNDRDQLSHTLVPLPRSPAPILSAGEHAQEPAVAE